MFNKYSFSISIMVLASYSVKISVLTSILVKQQDWEFSKISWLVVKSNLQQVSIKSVPIYLSYFFVTTEIWQGWWRVCVNELFANLYIITWLPSWTGSSNSTFCVQPEALAESFYDFEWWLFNGIKWGDYLIL